MDLLSGICTQIKLSHNCSQFSPSLRVEFDTFWAPLPATNLLMLPAVTCLTAIAGRPIQPSLEEDFWDVMSQMKTNYCEVIELNMRQIYLLDDDLV